jgi:hypothetical protein
VRGSIQAKLCWNAARSYGLPPGQGPRANGANAGLETRKVRGAAFGLSYVGMLPGAMVRPLAQAQELMKPRRPWKPEEAEGQHSDRAKLECCPELRRATCLRPGG